MNRGYWVLARLAASGLAAVLLVGSVAAAPWSATTSGRRPGIGQRDRKPTWWVDADTAVEPSVHALEAGQTIPNEVIVRVRPGVSPAALAQQFGLSLKRYVGLPGTVVLCAPPGGDARSRIGLLARSPHVVYATPNAPVRMMAVPNDPLYNEQWSLRLIKAPEAWDIQRGAIDNINPGVIVAVLDTGINFGHPDLQGRIAPGGTDIYNNDSDPADDNGHGSHVAGIIAAATNNGVGMAGMTWEGVRILPVKVLDRNGDGGVDKLASGIRYAADQGARIINLSVGTPDDDPTLRSAVQYALGAPQRPIIVCAAGNSSDRRPFPPTLGDVVYPANYPYDRIISVGAVGPDGRVAYYSSENTTPAGPSQGGVRIAAPGGSSQFSGDTARMIISTWWSPTRTAPYVYAEGTSQAAPFVAGAAALLLSEGVRTTDVESVLYSTATRTTSGRTEALGWGVLNVQAALQAAGPSLNLIWPTPDLPSETLSTLILARTRSTNLSSLQVSVDGSPVGGGTTQATSTGVDVRYRANLPTGTHTLSLSAASSLTGRTRTAQTTFRVAPHVLPAGVTMFSVPYFLSPSGASPTMVFGSQAFRMARYAPLDGQYALFDSTGAADVRASFNPPATGLADNPAGLGYWLRLAEPTALFLDGDPVLDAEYRIPVPRGWAMIGDPFVFPVALPAVQVQVGSSTVSMAQAVTNGWIRPQVYRFNGTDGYTTLSTTSTILNPWESVWVQAKTDVVLIFPGVK